MPNLPVSGNVSAEGSVSGEQVTTVVTQVDPDAWVTTLFRALKYYISLNIDEDIYDVRFEFPSAKDISDWMPLGKTIIHFEIDDISNPPFGFGDCVVAQVFDTQTLTITEQSEALVHIINLDVGIWASTRSGGVTARLNAYQLLNDLFAGASAYANAQSSIGIEIQSFSGASFLKEEIDDQSIFRVTNMTLVIRFYSRKTTGGIPYVGTFTLEPELTDEDGNPVS